MWTAEANFERLKFGGKARQNSLLNLPETSLYHFKVENPLGEIQQSIEMSLRACDGCRVRKVRVSA